MILKNLFDGNGVSVEDEEDVTEPQVVGMV